MINANELRVGNLVTDEFYEHFKTVIRVGSINEAGINLEVADDGNISEIANHFIEPEYRFEKIYPIHLTPEILEKAGFKKTVNEDDFDTWFNKIEIWQHDEGFCHSYAFGGDVNYLHQLQNIFYSLTGEELPIQL